MSSGNLFFAPLPGTPLPSRNPLIRKLRDIGLIGTVYDEGEGRFLAGERFLQLITFMGCSPYLRLEPPDDQGKDFCHVRMRGPYEEAIFIYGSNTRQPRCPQCGQRLEEWRSMIDALHSNGRDTAVCSGCGAHLDPGRVAWRRDAGFARFFLQVTDIFPGEAVPVPELMDTLEDGGKPWHYFYAQEPVVVSPGV